MKTKFLSLMFVLISTSLGLAQTKLDGIGKIRLGMTFEQLNEFIMTPETRMLDHHYNVDDLLIIQIARYEPIEGYYLKGMTLSFTKSNCLK